MNQNFKNNMSMLGELLVKFAVGIVIAGGITIAIGAPIIKFQEKQIEKKVEIYRQAGHTEQEVVEYRQMLRDKLWINLSHDRS